MAYPTDYDSDGMKAGSSSNDQRRALVAAPDGPHWPARTQTQPEILKITPRPIDLVYALRRRWGWALGLGILAAAATALAAWFLIPVNYTATAWLRIASAKPSIMFKVGGEDELLNDKRAQATLMTSQFVLSQALLKPGVSQLEYLRNEEDRLTWLKQNVRVSFPGNSEILQIAMTGDDPSQLVDLVNAVKDAYMQEVVGVDRQNHLRRKQVLERSYGRNVDEIKKKSKRYEELANEMEAPFSEVAIAKAQGAIETSETLKNSIIRLKGEVRGMARRINILQARLDKATYGEDEPASEEERKERALERAKRRMMEAALAREPWIANAQNQIVALDAAIFEEKQRAAHEDAPSILRMKDRIKVLQEGIADRVKEVQPRYVEQIEQHFKEQYADGLQLDPQTPREEAMAELDRMKIDEAVLQTELDEATKAFEENRKGIGELGANAIELESRKTELDRLKKITERMGNELEQWEVELQAAPRVSILEPASVPKTSDIRKKRRVVLFASSAAFGLAVLLVAGVDFLSRRVNSPAEVAYGLGVQVMGDVPAISGRWRHHGALNGASGPLQGMLTESIDNIRTALLYRAAKDSIRVTMVTSSLEKEGKTTVASQLAASLARSGRRTLFLDGDLRRPTAHRLFELPVTPGLSEVLRGEATLEDVIRPTRVAGLWLIPAGRCDQDAIQALASDGLREDMEKLREEFDFIMIDSGPVLTDSDALLFGRYSDAVLLSVMRDVSRVPQVYEACERIRAVNIPLLGAIVNGVGMGKYRSYYRPYSVRTEAEVA